MNNQIFVKIDEYDEVLNLMKLVNDKIAKSEDMINKIKKLKKDEEKELESWEDNLKKMKSSLDNIEAEFFEK